jgi:beta-phosphoglucomutase-like phosphatase (HAD superfamily)
LIFERFGLETTEAMQQRMFEDSHSGVMAARAAGMGVISARTTLVNLPGTHITIDNLFSGDLEPWLFAQYRTA